jgi:hypothetical protein
MLEVRYYIMLLGDAWYFGYFTERNLAPLHSNEVAMRKTSMLLGCVVIVIIALVVTVVNVRPTQASAPQSHKPSSGTAFRSASFPTTAIPNNGTVVTLLTLTFTMRASGAIAVQSDQSALIGGCCGGGPTAQANLTCSVILDGTAIMTRQRTWYYSSDDGFDIAGSANVAKGMHTVTLTCSSTLGQLSVESGGTLLIMYTS